jgi:hypothetical protein
VGYQLRQGHSTQAEAEPLPKPSFVTSAHPSYAIVQPRTALALIPDDSNNTSLIPTRSVSTPSLTCHPRRDTYASGSGLGNNHARHNDQRNNDGCGRGSGRGGREGGRGGPKRQDKGKGCENSAHVANDASGGNFAAHAVLGPSQVLSAPEPRSLIDRISAPADPLSAEDLDLVDSELAAGRLWFGVAPGSDYDVKLQRIVCSHIVERRRLLNAEYAVKPAHAPKHPVSSLLASRLDPHPRVAHDLSHKQRKALKDNKALGKDRLGAPSVITGTYCDQRYELPLPPWVAEMGAKINASYKLDHKGLLSDDNSNTSEPDDAWFERADAINAQETQKLSRFVLSPKRKVSPVAVVSSLRSKRSKRPQVVEEVAAVSDGLDSEGSLSQGDTPLGTPADGSPLASLGMSIDDNKYVHSPNSSQSHANEQRTGSAPDCVLIPSTLRSSCIYTACTLAHSNFIYLCMHNLDYARCCYALTRRGAGNTGVHRSW